MAGDDISIGIYRGRNVFVGTRELLSSAQFAKRNTDLAGSNLDEEKSGADLRTSNSDQAFLSEDEDRKKKDQDKSEADQDRSETDVLKILSPQVIQKGPRSPDV